MQIPPVMEIARPVQTYTAEPLSDPVPKAKPAEKPSQLPRERPGGAPSRGATQ